MYSKVEKPRLLLLSMTSSAWSQSLHCVGRNCRLYVTVAMTVLLRLQEEYEDTIGVILIRKSKKVRKYNGQKKKDKRKNNDLQNTTQKTKE